MNKEENSTGSFIAFVLLSDTQWDINQLINDCKTDWNIELPNDSQDNTLYTKIGDMTLVISLMPIPIPNKEVEYHAATNYMWEDAVEISKSHKAHLLVSVLGKDANVLDKGKLFTKVISSCLKQENTIAVYTDGAVFQPQFYREVASIMQQDENTLPILNWVWFGIYHTDEFAGIYTYGMRKFGKEEIEVYASNADLIEIRNFLLDVVAYILDANITLQDGETIGFSAEQKLSITLSDAIALDGKSLKIQYPQ
ncbi:DUF4261 domain-containing protein [Pelistega ratti]|uniref:DUF4261 domain-containing protein n=1 Tax=Pelistega ratti TaxID=2652177 RepID=UPI001357736D|nr:DUF4261 domain-containing protein [Pelistega ratti]